MDPVSQGSSLASRGVSGPHTPILVLGSGGFIGRAVTAALSRAGFTDIRAGSRRPDPTPGPSGAAVSQVACDVLDPSSLKPALDGVGVVVSCYRESSEEEGRRAIANLMDACKAAGVGRQIYLSSIAVYGDAEGDVTEDAPLAGDVGWYGSVKRLAEEACRARASGTLQIAVLRPSLVY